MTVLMILAVFAAFVGLDLGVQFLRRRRALRGAGAPAGVFALPASMVGGLRLPRGVGFHGRHTWARALDPVTVLVGIDDLAARLLGRASGVVVPVPGARVREGVRGFRVRADNRVADLVSPVDGTVVEVNPALDDDPALCVAAPYDQGWLCKVRVADAASAVARLVQDRAAAHWMRDERARLMDGLAACAGGRLAADGGEPVDDLGTHLDRETWEVLVRDFLAADSQRRTREDGR